MLAPPPDTLDAQPNDQRHAAGRADGDSLVVALVLREARWRPGGAVWPAITIPAVGVAGEPPMIPAPLLRIEEGRRLVATIHNQLGERAVVHGLGAHAGLDDSVVVEPGATARIATRMTARGTHFYWVRTTRSARPFGRGRDSQMGGALVVDAAGSRPDPKERILVITTWDDSVRAPGFARDHRQVFAINGRSFPFTEPLDVALGDTVRWRVINAGDHAHPMHLHGFYFDVLSRGTSLRDTTFAPPERPRAVTEFLTSASSAMIQWVAGTPGNWLFHCHAIGHIDPRLRLDRVADGASSPSHERAMSHASLTDAMSGLVMRVSVRSRVPVRTDPRRPPERRLVVLATERAGGADGPELRYVVGDASGAEGALAGTASMPLVLREGERTEITVRNVMTRATAVHWHGIELESYFDGVAGWSGTGRAGGPMTAPVIAPGDSFRVRITPRRAGTFMYHTHMDEDVQLRRGLAAPFIVLPRGTAPPDTTERFLLVDERTARVTGYAPDVPDDRMAMTAGRTRRLRIMVIPTDDPMRVRLFDGDSVVSWRVLAKDGADLAPALAARRVPAIATMGAGETMDVELEGRPGATLVLHVLRLGVGTVVARIPVTVP
ncbi:MAG: multicopper oxidase domain-containing protein [Gemmatimonadetes bacterium]|nr:multicopper oxidase domain-containing protein [Gemmatimonadota bacterium]